MIAEIKARLDIVACLSHFGVDVRPGTRRVVKVCCPFHDDKDPSLAIYVQENRARCFGCQQGGDVLDLTRLFKNCSTKEAVAYWRRQLGLEGIRPTPRYQITEEQQLRRLRQQVTQRSIELECFPGIPKVLVMDDYLVWVFGEKDEVDSLYRRAETKQELLAYLEELERWHTWAAAILQGAWGCRASRALHAPARDLEPQAVDAYQSIDRDGPAAQEGSACARPWLSAQNGAKERAQLGHSEGKHAVQRA